MRSLGITEAAERLTEGEEFLVELALGGKYVVPCFIFLSMWLLVRYLSWRLLTFGCSSRTSSDVGYELGWREEKAKEDFKKHFLEEAKFIIGAQ